jgi:hypothetical protein
MYISEEHQQRVLEQPVPTWIVVHPIQAPNTIAPDGAGHSALLSDSQHNLESSTLYRRIAYYLPNHAAVQHGSRIEINFSPDAEQLIFHTLQIQRAGGGVDLLPTQEVRVLHREAQMERFVFDGRLLAVLVLNDVRAGDIIDYSYSLQATKAPLFGRHHGHFLLRGGFRADAIRCRLLYREGRVLYVAPRRTDLQEVATLTEEGLVDCRWQLDDVRPFPFEADIPNWALPFQWIDYGEFATWGEVADAAARLFNVSPEPFPDYLAEWLEQTHAAAASPEQFILQLIRYVQEQIRYVSVSLDEHSHSPYDITTILHRNYGDCKDKTTLLCVLLRKAGFDAVPALVNTQLRAYAIEGLPRPYAFNHVIGRLRYAGKTHWIDATLTDQGGQLDTLSHPPYGVALVLDGAEDPLATVPPAPVVPSVNYDEKATVHQTGGTAELHITRTFFGALADDMRHRLTASGLDELEKAIVTDYRRHYPEISVLSPSTAADNRDANQITFVHVLLVGGIWKEVRAAKGKVAALFQARFPASGILPLLRLPAPGERIHPYSHPFPLSVKSTFRLLMPRNFKAAQHNAVLQSTAFTCQFSSNGKDNSGWVTFQYNSLSDHLLPKDLPEHEKAIRQLDRSAFYYINGPRPQMATVQRPAEIRGPDGVPSHVPPRRR